MSFTSDVTIPTEKPRLHTEQEQCWMIASSFDQVMVNISLLIRQGGSWPGVDRPTLLLRWAINAVLFSCWLNNTFDKVNRVTIRKWVHDLVSFLQLKSLLMDSLSTVVNKSVSKVINPECSWAGWSQSPNPRRHLHDNLLLGNAAWGAYKRGSNRDTFYIDRSDTVTLIAFMNNIFYKNTRRKLFKSYYLLHIALYQ